MGVELVNRPIAITGASSGIGAATALACARAGMPVVLGARRLDRLERVAEQVRAIGGKAVCVELDVRDAAACTAFLDRAYETYGSLYAVYANAGYGVEKPMHEMTDAELREIFETNFWGTMNVVRPFVRRMIDQPRRYAPHRGHVLICSSCLGKMALPFYGAYCATKAAQSHVGRAMRLELERYDVQVSVVHPITTKTEFFARVKDQLGAPESAGAPAAAQQPLTDHAPRWMAQTPDYVAARTVACLRRPRPEVWTGVRGWFVRFGMTVNTLFPRLADVTLRSMAAKRKDV